MRRGERRSIHYRQPEHHARKCDRASKFSRVRAPERKLSVNYGGGVRGLEGYRNQVLGNHTLREQVVGNWMITTVGPQHLVRQLKLDIIVDHLPVASVRPESGLSVPRVRPAGPSLCV